MPNVAVFFGGKSYEREISILTGVFVLNLLLNGKYTIVPIYVHTDGGMYTSSAMYDLESFRRKKMENFQKIFLAGATV